MGLKSRFWFWPFKDILRHVPKPLQRCLDCVLILSHWSWRLSTCFSSYFFSLRSAPAACGCQGLASQNEQMTSIALFPLCIQVQKHFIYFFATVCRLNTNIFKPIYPNFTGDPNISKHIKYISWILVIVPKMMQKTADVFFCSNSGVLVKTIFSQVSFK